MRTHLLVCLGLAVVVGCGDEVTIENAAGSGGMASSGANGTATSGSGSQVTVGQGGSSASTGNNGAGGATMITCNPTTVACDAPTPVCPAGEVPEVVAGCWGECIPILDCPTEPNCNNCQGFFCAEYVGFVTEYRCVIPTFMCSATVCACMAPYFCADPYDVCVDNPPQGVVSCECTTC